MLSVVRRSRFIGSMAVVMLMVALTVTIPQTAGAATRPKIIPLPDGFQPEGIAAQRTQFFAGSLVDGAIYKGSLRTGEGDIFVPGTPGRVAVGMKVRRNVLFVAGGPTGDGYAYNTRTGRDLGVFDLTDAESTFVNDVITTRKAAWFTDSFNQQLYKVPIRDRGEFGRPKVVPLTGDIVFVPGEFNVNGIEAAPLGKRLIVVQSNTGQLFEVKPRTGETSEIDLGGESVPSGDGILLDRGRGLWVVQNAIATLTLVDLDSDLESGEVESRTTDEDFDVPTTVAKSGNYLAIVNARFGLTEPEKAEYSITQIRKPR